MYNKFIEKYKNQKINKNSYSEKHHIIPKHMGGINKETNIITLYYRQHILAHLLLFRKYKNYKDLCAYRLMRSISSDRKKEISRAIGMNHVKTGHIIKLGQLNKETNWINNIKTKESLRKGGKAAGKIAKETGQVYTIRTKESCSRGGKTSGALSKQRGIIQNVAKFKGLYVLIMPDGKEFLHTFQAAEYMNLPKTLVNSRCKQGHMGYSRRLKKKEELGMRGILLKECN